MSTTQILPYVRLPEDSRLSAEPICREEIFRVYEEAVAVHWVHKQINYSEDPGHYARSAPAVQELIIGPIAFFSVLDTLVNINITERFEMELDIPEVRWFYAQQKHIENIHALTYSKFIHVYVTDEGRRQKLFNAVQEYPAIRRVAEFVERCVSSTESLGARLFRMACVEGVLFARAFAIIRYVCTGGKFPGLYEANELIARDEGWHTVGAAVIHNTILSPHAKATTEEAYAILREVEELAAELGHEAIRAPLQGMNEASLAEYTRNQANVVASWFGLEPYFKGATNPFEFMNTINLQSRANFFEVRETNYHAGHDNNASPVDAEDCELTEDF